MVRDGWYNESVIYKQRVSLDSQTLDKLDSSKVPVRLKIYGGTQVTPPNRHICALKTETGTWLNLPTN